MHGHTYQIVHLVGFITKLLSNVCGKPIFLYKFYAYDFIIKTPGPKFLTILMIYRWSFIYCA